MKQKNYDYVYEDHSKLTPLVEKYILNKLVDRLPRWVTPNHITIMSQIACWLYFLMAIFAHNQGENFAMKSVYFLLAAFFVFIYLCTDALDGKYARKTGQSSRFGEILDHWMDAMHVPILALGFYVATSAPWWGFLGIGLISAAPYTMQLIVYLKTGRFVHPRNGGMEAGFTLILGLICFIPFFLFMPYEYLNVYTFTIPLIALELTFFEFAVWGLAITVALGHFPPLLFYIRMSPKDFKFMIPYLLIMSGVAVLLTINQINIWIFSGFVIGISLKINGALVITAAIQKKEMPILDKPLVGLLSLLLILAFINHYTAIPQEVMGLLSVGGLVYLSIRSLLDLQGAYAILHGNQPIINRWKNT